MLFLCATKAMVSFIFVFFRIQHNSKCLVILIKSMSLLPSERTGTEAGTEFMNVVLGFRFS